ncbi:hypothetical protein JFL43_18155 [Viridibacillus sp. YIM B01967]|uniref:Uncharacterized protein n=1 Tax=Viridibacillus soli TaxID=2798301 RepID=A0ABS1HBF8_9BACL|nr:hypothetical protein [Viridibacillus soli]MBK3496750.1 hypothetical protein [Viridibacillus soli]
MESKIEVRSTIKRCFQPSFSQLENASKPVIPLFGLAHLKVGKMKPIFTINET